MKNASKLLKHYLLAIFLLVACTESISQVLISLLLGDKLNSEGLEFGLEGGFNWSNISNLEASKSLSTFNLGFYFNIRMKNQWYLNTGVLVKSKLGVGQLSANDLAILQADIYTVEGDYNQAISYFLVPALAKYKFKNHLYLAAGPQFGLMYKAWVEFISDVDGKKANIREFNKELIRRLDAGLMVGIGYTLMKGTGMTLGAKYYYGLVDVYKDIPGTNNSSFFLKLDIPIGANKEK